ncbi:Ankyrin repeat, PH and SEC7 domain containing protein secG [Frankliniella fusca]|uniref:Ankyrin repeat, PH and SEC7 domain containing protein secG n=1 Tax=Frankliniella fusca TaxID=407009 RepID=A0AAE1LQN9_9NEOP|nr:Ankyrin repeat, PH and SEC7 domain containing protein secG [Frankliniella fusca]
MSTFTESDSSSPVDISPMTSTANMSWEERLYIAISQGDTRTVRSLVDRGVNVNSTHPSGRTPLGAAAHLGNIEILRMLLEPVLNPISQETLHKSKKGSRRYEAETGSWCGGTSPKARKSTTVAAEKRVKAARHSYEIQGTNLSPCSACRQDSLSSDEEVFDFRRDGLKTRQRHSKGQRDMTKTKSDVNEPIFTSDFQSKNNCFSGSEEARQRVNEREKSESNQGYYIVVHNEYSPTKDKSDDKCGNNVCDVSVKEPVTPDDMDNLEWDSELQPEEFNSPVDDSTNSDSWVDLYRWYADYLAQSCAVDRSMQDRTSLHIDVNQLDMYRRGAMHYAAEQGNLEVLHILLRAGCSVDIGDSDDVTPLHLAAARDNPEAVALLINCGAKVNRKSIDGTGPLHMAAARGFIETANILLKHGASVNALDRSDRTPLLLAVSRGLEDMVKLLISHGAKVNVEDILGYTPLCQAVWQQEKEIVSLLLAAGAKLTHSDRLLHCAILHRCPDIARLLISAGSIVNLRDDSGDTPLILAARSGQIDVVNLLLYNGAMASYPNGLTGSTPLHEAVECLRPAQYRILKEILLCLLRHKGPTGLLDVESSSTYDTPLVRALIHDKDHAMILLIQHGADVNVLQEHTPIVSEEYLKKRPNRLVIGQLMVCAGLNLWKWLRNLDPKHEKYPDDSVAAWISAMKFNPMSLAGLARLSYRHFHGEDLYKAVETSGLPVTLKKFIMLEDIVNLDEYALSIY